MVLPPQGMCRNFLTLHTLLTSGSRTISRVLSCGCPHQTVIPLGAQLPAPSSNLPGRQWSGRPPSLFGLAPNGVCRACRVTAASGGLLPHRFTLTPPRGGAVCFLWRCPRVAPPGCYPAFCPVEPGLSSPGLAARSDGLSNSHLLFWLPGAASDDAAPGKDCFSTKSM